jgi:hypothetical protein
LPDAPHIWAFDHLADAVAAGLARAEADLAAEQAVHGLDIRRELDIHPILHAGLRAAGYGVTPEQRFPRDRVHRRRSQGVRCDLVVTPAASRSPTTPSNRTSSPRAPPRR